MLKLPGRRGFTLVEMMLAVVIMLIVAGAVHNLLVTTQRVSRAQAERVSLQSAVRGGSLVVLNELRELSTVAGGTADQNDILGFGPNAITYRATRGIGFVCQAPRGNQIRIGRNDFTGHRDPQPGRDAAYVFIEASPETQTDDFWLPVTIVGVSPTTGCPGVGAPGIALTTSGNPPVPGLDIGTPVRIYEVMELKLYQSGGSSWLGARSVSAGEAVQPVVGPLTDGTGFQLEYLNSIGVPTTDATTIKSIRVSIRGIIDRPGSGLAPVEEELFTQVTLRNASRP